MSSSHPSTTQTQTHPLSELNSATLGAKFPEVTLPDGSKVQTGTVGALLSNIKTYDTLYRSTGGGGGDDDDGDDAPPTTGPGDRYAIEKQLEGLERAFRTALPLLFRVGLFELFEPEEWIAGKREGGGDSPGRRKVGELAVQWRREQQMNQK